MKLKKITKAQKTEAMKQIEISFQDEEMTGFFFSYNTPDGRFSISNGDLRGMKADIRSVAKP